MKTLVIHPEDSTTNMLSVIYKNTDWTVITDNFISKRKLKESIKEHDKIIMLGHGNNYGLFGKKRLIIDSSLVYLLRDKYCISIWCNADIFFEKYNLNGLYSGMVISEYEEALDCSVECKPIDVDESNKLLGLAIKEMIKYDDINYLKLIYKDNSNNNNVINFNKDKFYKKTKL